MFSPLIELKKVIVLPVFFLQSNARPLDAELFPRLSKFMAEMASNEYSPPSTPAHTDADDHHHHFSNDSHAQQPTTYIINGNGIATNLNLATSSYYPTNGETKNVIVYNGSSVPVSTSPPATIERTARDWSADSIDDVNAATAMLALKHGPKVFTETFQNG